jgi:hypothetical protein
MKYRFLLLLLFIVITEVVSSQNTIQRRMQKRTELTAAYELIIETMDPSTFLKKYRSSFSKVYQHNTAFRIAVNNAAVVDSLLNDPSITFISAGRKAKEESVINGFDIAVNKVNLAHARYPEVTGIGAHVSIKERMPDTADIDYRDRYLKTSNAATTLNSHATIMSTIAVGAGNTHYSGKGVAFKANISSATFDNLLPESDAFYKQNNITVQNHSYGTGIEPYYGADANAYDNSVISYPQLLHVFSAGNSGTAASTTGSYSGIAGFSNLTGSFKQSKNTLSVAATDAFYNVAALSSKGPTHDGRVKPELVALGEDGSSGAAALVSGTALLVQQAWKQKTNVLPDASLVKAVLINSADDVGNANVDFSSGFGSLNTYKAVQTIREGRVMEGSVTNNSSTNFNISVPANIKTVKITLVWTDTPAASGATKALINDLDAELINTTTNEKWLPWVLNHFPHKDSLSLPAVRKKDTLNNVEQITIDNPSSGIYQLNVFGAKVNAAQKFHIAYQFDTLNIFQFTNPTRIDNLLANANNTIRWSSGFPAGTNGSLQISYNEGAVWETIASNIDLSKAYFQIPIKDTTSLSLLRMLIGTSSYHLDTFTVSSKPDISVGFNCADSVMLNFSKFKGIQQYQLFKLLNGEMQPFLVTGDTTVIIKNMQEKFVAVAPIIKNKFGVKSFTTNYSTQGVGCYINNFIADKVTENKVHLKASLGAVVGVKTITFEKIKNNVFVPISVQSATNVNFYEAFDTSLVQGINYYRVKIDLTNGTAVYSDVVSVYGFGETSYILFPNPVKAGKPVYILSNELSAYHFLLFNNEGKQVHSAKLQNSLETVKIPTVHKGIYFYKIIRSEGAPITGKLIVE